MCLLCPYLSVLCCAATVAGTAPQRGPGVWGVWEAEPPPVCRADRTPTAHTASLPGCFRRGLLGFQVISRPLELRLQPAHGRVCSPLMATPAPDGIRPQTRLPWTAGWPEMARSPCQPQPQRCTCRMLTTKLGGACRGRCLCITSGCRWAGWNSHRVCKQTQPQGTRSGTCSCRLFP